MMAGNLLKVSFLRSTFWLALSMSIPTNEDYEILLMQLISGEGGYVFADETMQDDLRNEVTSSNPDLTALRTYGAARITLAREQVRRVLKLAPDEMPQAPAAAEPRPVRPPPSPGEVIGDPTADAPLARKAPPPACQFCGQKLPDGRTVHFCPQCGLNVSTRRCAGCSSEIQPGWRFCVNCGRAIGSRQ